MSKPLDFTKMKKKYLTVTLADKNSTVLMIGSPTKAIMDDLQALEELIGDTGDDNTEITEGLFDACARVMSRNKDNIEITKDFLSEIFDFEDIVIFFNAYMEFVKEVIGEKN